MHEHGLGDLILHDIEDRFPAVPAGGHLEVRVRFSELSGVIQEALQAAMDHAAEHHHAPPVHLEVVSDGLLGRCADCGAVSAVNEDLACLVCKSTRVSLCAGETMLIEEVRICPTEVPGGG